jgi:hypothetical protein
MKVAEKMAKSLSSFVNTSLALALGFILDGDKSISIWNKWNRPNKFGVEKKRFENIKETFEEMMSSKDATAFSWMTQSRMALRKSWHSTKMTLRRMYNRFYNNSENYSTEWHLAECQPAQKHPVKWQ